jgi:Ca2+-binding EF-hand superfamily protein
MRAFKLFDEVGKGCVVLEDLQRISNDLGEGFTEDELEEMLVFADKKGDGLLQPKDFVRIARQINL